MIKLEMILYSTEAWEKYVAHTQSKMLVKADLRPHDHDIDEVLIDAINQAINNNVNEIHVIKSEHDNFDDVMTLIKELASNIKGYSIELT